MLLAPTPFRSRTLRLVVLIAAVVSLALVAPGTAHACSCAPPPPPETALREADAVFTGAVTDITDRGGQAVARLTVEAVYSGQVPSEVEVHTATDSAACGYPFEVGREELVYAVLDAEGRLLTNLCDRTAPTADAAEDLTTLGDGDRPEAGAAAPGDRGGGPSPLAVTVALLLVTITAAAVVARRRSTGDA
ncbi:hypothetical protein [Nitriliruptor alkaliphilus]|uniref:hypothetical protein n=1 Tax=Nitriliruptor alkaliphilus TaxID=427918 RepID=UPI000698DA0F|nr:hypothetical protein [Nitriliruptor alkaliphilus]